jgi:hypothetical protein
MGLRHDAADTFRIQAEQAIATKDYGKALQRAKYSAALHRTTQNLKTYGAAAALAGKPAEGYDAFADAYQSQAEVESIRGELVTAAMAGEQPQTQTAAQLLMAKQPGAFDRALVAHALVASGNLAAARDISGDPQSGPEAAARAIATAPENQTDALALLERGSRNGISPPADTEGLKQLESQLTTLPEEARLKLTTTITAMQRPASSATRQLLLAKRLLEFKRFQAARLLADQAVHDEPGYRDAWNTLAAAQLELRDDTGAGRSLKISEELDGAYGYTWYLKSQLAKAQGKDDVAKQYAEHAELLGFHSE